MLIRLCKLGCGFFASTLAKDAPLGWAAQARKLHLFRWSFRYYCAIKITFYKIAEFLNSHFNYWHGEGHERGSAHVCKEMRSERLYLSVYSDDITIEGATPYDVAPSIVENRARKD